MKPQNLPYVVPMCGGLRMASKTEASTHDRVDRRGIKRPAGSQAVRDGGSVGDRGQGGLRPCTP